MSCRSFRSRTCKSVALLESRGSVNVSSEETSMSHDGNSSRFQRGGGVSRPRCGRARDAAAPPVRVRDVRPLDRRPGPPDDRGAGRVRQRRRLRHGRGEDGGVVRRTARADGRRGDLVLPGVGPVVVAGPLAASMLAGIEGAIAGTAWAAWPAPWSAGASRRSGPSSTRRRSRGASSSSSSGAIPRSIAHARNLIDPHAAEHLELFEPAAVLIGSRQ